MDQIFFRGRLILVFLHLSINNKLQNPEAANGVLNYAMNNSKVDVVSLQKQS